MEEKMSGSLAYLKDVWKTEGHHQGYDEGRTQGYDEGRTQGYDEGRTQGYDEGHIQGYDEGKLNNMVRSVESLMDSMQIGIDEAIHLLKIDPKERKRVKEALMS